jgi:prepilin-type N-terminal cleavage/methylation domain-containing protein
MRRGIRAFTLIELLVVIAIIALLIGILLPSLGKARNAARMTISLSNLRQIGNGVQNYQTDNKGKFPMRPTPQDWPPQPTTPTGWDSWSYGGNNTSAYWAGRGNDEWASRRPLNPWIYPEYTFDPIQTGWTDAERGRLKMEAFRSPGDKITYQRDWPNGDASVVGGSYADVGTSYHMNVKWADPTGSENLAKNPELQALLDRFNRGRARKVSGSQVRTGQWNIVSQWWDFNSTMFREGAIHVSTKVIWIHDQTIDLVANADDPRFGTTDENRRGEFGDVNRGCASFLDGHAAYITVTPGKAKTNSYQFLFDPS